LTRKAATLAKSPEMCGFDAGFGGWGKLQMRESQGKLDSWNHGAHAMVITGREQSKTA
jgi:hypothetical protein